jgi:putative ATPase
LIILAGEDIGLADPMGLVVANSAAEAFDKIGMPEGLYPLVEATLYLSTAPKSNSAGAYFKIADKIEKNGAGEVPNHLKDNSRDAQGLGHGKGYIYPHSFEGHYTPQQYLPDDYKDLRFYEPSNEGYEKIILERLKSWREKK